MDYGTIIELGSVYITGAHPRDVGGSQRVGVLRSPVGESVGVPLGAQLVVQGSMVDLRGCDWYSCGAE